MINYAVSSAVRNRSATAIMLVVAVGAGLISAMAGICAAGLAPGARPQDRDFLVQFPMIMGGWILAITIFAVVSTVSVTLAGRTAEIDSLRLAGATPRQVQLIIALQTGVGSLIAVAAGVLAGYPLDWLIMNRIRATGLIADPSGFAPGLLLPVIGGALVLIAATLGGFLGARTLARRPLFGAPGVSRRRPAGRRRAVALVAMIIGLISSISTLALDPDQIYATATTGPGCVLITVGLALLAPETLGLAGAVLRRLPDDSRVARYLARANLAAAPQRLQPLVTFLTLFVGIAVGTLTMQQVESSHQVAPSSAMAAGGMADVMAAINYFVVALIGAFMAIALINSLTAAVRQRRTEFATMRLIGSTGAQTRRMVLLESGFATAVAGAAGILAGIVSVIPFAILKTGTPAPSLALPVLLIVIAAGTLLTLATTSLAVNRSLAPA